MHKTVSVRVDNVLIGGNAPVVIQSMTDTATADIDATVTQIMALANAGSELVRITVDTDEAAKAVCEIKDKLIQKSCKVPLVGDFHYNGHKLLTNYPYCAEALSKYRINPGNVGFGDKKDKQFAQIIEQAIRHKKPIRIGVNWGSLDQDLLAKMMDENITRYHPLTNRQIMQQALVNSALESAEEAERIGLEHNKIVLSCKVSDVNDLIEVYNKLANECEYPLHLGLTEAGMGLKSIVATSIALGSLLHNGIGNTIRASLTPEPGGVRVKEVHVCKEILQSLGIRSFAPSVSSCPGCGRTKSSFFRELAQSIQNHLEQQMPIWKNTHPGVEKMTVAVMGCIVNGPGESKHADIGISLPGSGEQPVAPVFIDGKKARTLRGDRIIKDFKNIIDDYVQKRYILQQELNY